MHISNIFNKPLHLKALKRELGKVVDQALDVNINNNYYTCKYKGFKNRTDR